MSVVLLCLLTFLIFLGIDFLGLGTIVKPVFERHIGHLMLSDIRLLPAFAFYAFYVFVSACPACASSGSASAIGR